MKVKNIAFSGFMAAILMGATGANAALNVASTDYVDAKTGAVATTVSNVNQDLQTFKTTVSTTYETIEHAASVAEDLAADAEQIAKDAKSYTETKIAELSEQLMGGGEGSEDQGLTGKVTANTLAIDGLKTRATDLETLVGSTAVATQIANAISASEGTTKTAYEAADSALQGEIDAVEGRATALEGLVGTTAVATQISDAISASEATTEAAYKEYVDTSFGELNTNVATKQEELGADNVIQNGTGVVKTVVADDGTLTATASLVATADIDDNAVTTAKIADGNVTTAKIADGNVTDAKIASVDQAKVSGLTNAAGETVSLAAALTSKITMPEVCEKTTCVLTVDSASGTVTWAPLFTADDATSGS